jgi:Reverse transcriptase (RNA-dependent DNA polymerase)
VGIQRKRVNWVLDADIRGFFDNMNHEWTMKFVEHRVADRRILRLIQKWLKAGVSEDGQWSESTVGTPQGAVVSPRSNGSFTVWRKTAKKRMVAKLQAIKAELHRRMHEPTADVGAWLRKVVTGLPPLLCSPGKHRPVECLRATSAATVAAHSSPPQPTTRRVGSVLPDLHAVDSSSTCSASLSYSPLPRHSSKVGAVCVEALVRICAGGDQR